MKSNQLILSTFKQKPAQIFTDLLSKKYQVVTLTDILREKPADLDINTPVIYSLSQTKTPEYLKYYKELRSRKFIWNPVIFLSQSHQIPDYDSIWEISHLHFPVNSEQLLEKIGNCLPVSKEMQEKITYSSIRDIVSLLEDYFLYRRGLYIKNNNEWKILFLQIADKIKSLSDFSQFQEYLAQSSRLPEEETDMASLHNCVLMAEKTAREYKDNKEQDKYSSIRSNLHKLNNLIRFTADKTNTLPDISKDILEITTNLPASFLPGSTLKDLNKLSSIILSLQEEILDASISGDILNNQDKTTQGLLEKIHANLAAQFNTYPHPNKTSQNIKNIIVIEDDPGWQENIRNLLNKMAQDTEITYSTNCQDARQLLKKANEQTLVLVDLGLPASENDKLINLDAGYQLIKEYLTEHKNNIPKFIILTATQNYSDMVRDCIHAGIQPWDYIQKNPQWKNQLSLRLLVNLNPVFPATLLPEVDIFKSTTRLITINKKEILLNRKPYFVFEHLANFANKWCPVDKMRKLLTQPGPGDITPAMNENQLSDLKNGKTITPYDLLTSKHIQDYIYEINKSIRESLQSISSSNETSEIITYNPEMDAYKLNAKAHFYNTFKEYSQGHPSLKVLVVEDNEKYHNLLVETVKNKGFETRGVYTKEDFFKETENDNWIPDIVTLDLELPEDQQELTHNITNHKIGLYLLKYIKNNWPETRVIVVTGYTLDDSVLLDILKREVRLADYIDKNWDSFLDRLSVSLWRNTLELQHSTIVPDQHHLFTVASIKPSPQINNEFLINNHSVRLSPHTSKLFKILLENANIAVNRDLIAEQLWSVEELSDSYEDSLNTMIRRLRNEISEQTNNLVNGKDIIKSADGVYWVQGILMEDENGS